jgi:uncharacterized protein (TIGR04255 family)
VIRLPPPNRSILPRSPLDLVILQLRFGEPIAVEDERTVFALRDALQARDRRFVPERVHGVSFTVGPIPSAAPPTVEQAAMVGWRFAAGPTTVQLAVDALTVETRAYEGWQSFVELFAAALRPVAETVAPRSEARLGLRMIDKIPRPAARRAVDLLPALRAWLRGPLADEDLAQGVLSLQHQCELEADVGRITVRTALFEDPEARGALTLLLDYDSFRSGYRPFDLEGVLLAATELNGLCLQLFRHSISDDLYEEFAHA